MSQDGPHRLLPRSALTNTAALFLCYWLAWKTSAVFEVQAHVSALYLSAGLTTAVGMIGGWRHLPVAFLAICVVRQLDMPGPLLEGIDWGGALRQVLVYGGTGVLMRPRWLAMPARLTLADALRYVLLAFAATSVSAAATLFIPPFDTLPASELGAVFLSFWGGDFAGLLLGLPVDGVLDLQLVLAMSAATALVAGAAHDDKHFEWQHANFDLLTGLANRHRFQDQLEHELMRASRSKQPLALMYIDLDGFKAVNDGLGHTLLERLQQPFELDGRTAHILASIATPPDLPAAAPASA